MTNVELIKQGYSNFAIGNVEAVLANFHPQIEWNECKGMPFVKGDGLSVGIDAIVTNVFMNLPVYFDGFNIAVNEIFGADDNATGNPFKANATHVWTLKDGKMTHFFQAVDTATINS
jgi:ketosteroid isomerase-like protein